MRFLKNSPKNAKYSFFGSPRKKNLFTEKINYVIFLFLKNFAKKISYSSFSSNYKKSWTQNSNSEVGIPSDLAS
jgi:hypothetical protein